MIAEKFYRNVIIFYNFLLKHLQIWDFFCIFAWIFDVYTLILISCQNNTEVVTFGRFRT